MNKRLSRQPVLFLGHGSPMNAIEENGFTRALAALGARRTKPAAVLCVSAHWLTRGSVATGMARPRTIHDFGGFPEELYAIRYPAPGDPALAALVRESVGGSSVAIDETEWGLDHGAWSVLRHMYPKADVPVVQLSLDCGASARRHFEVGEKLRPLREKGVLILGSGNVVHNLRRVSFDENAAPQSWAVEFDSWVKGRLEQRDLEALLGDLSGAPSGALAVPTRDHFDPLLYVLGASDEKDALRFEYEGIQNGSISMRCVSFGAA
ncbi:MAG: 4,5-DOPA dioxygenase extradiol [Elusimicrobiota bacterium]